MNAFQQTSDRPSRVASMWQMALPAGMLAVAMTLAGCNGGEQEMPAEPAGAETDLQAPPGVVVLTGDEAVAAVEAGDAKPYPLDVCLISGAPIGSMGPEAPIVYDGQEIKFCCPGCDKLLVADPDKYLAKLDAAVADADAATEADESAPAEHKHEHDHDHGEAHNHDHGHSHG